MSHSFAQTCENAVALATALEQFETHLQVIKTELNRDSPDRDGARTLVRKVILQRYVTRMQRLQCAYFTLFPLRYRINVINIELFNTEYRSCRHESIKALRLLSSAGVHAHIRLVFNVISGFM